MSSQQEFVRCANFPVDQEGRVHHVGVKPGDVANRVITVGDPLRAWKIAEFFDEKKEELKVITSSRGFTTITGHFQKIPISIVAIGMGTSMMDFFVREVRAVVVGPLYIVRFGSCGSLSNEAEVGSLALASEAMGCFRNFNYFTGDKTEDTKPYNLSKPVSGDSEFPKLLASLPNSDIKLYTGLNVTTDSFYCSQGRLTSHFQDDNQDLIETVQKTHPEVLSFEMETFQLYHLAACSIGNSIRAYAVHMIFADRPKNIFLGEELKNHVEPRAGKLVLEALSKVSL